MNWKNKVLNLVRWLIRYKEVPVNLPQIEVLQTQTFTSQSMSDFTKLKEAQYREVIKDSLIDAIYNQMKKSKDKLFLIKEAEVPFEDKFTMSISLQIIIPNDKK